MIVSVLLAALLAAQNPTYSPDSTKIAFTRDGDLYCITVSDSTEFRLTTDGGSGILNGYASWVYYEEIFGRPSNYRAFWWSPDSKKIAFYRFDESGVGIFPIHSPFGQYGSLNLTRYPKAGTPNPSVRIGIIDLASSSGANIIWADFNEGDDQYFGTPFWGSDSKSLYVQWEPRRQNTLKLYCVNSENGSKKDVYTETYPTWVRWIEGMLFGEKGLYMARDFETGWKQIYYLSYDGKTLDRLTEGKNWDVTLLRVDEKKGDIWFVAKRDSRIHPALYRLDRKGRITALTDPQLFARDIKLSENGFTAKLSTSAIPERTVEGSLKKFDCKVVSGPVEVPADRPVPEEIVIKNDGYDLYGLVSFPRGFDRSKKYPVLITLYGGPGTAYVRDWWANRDASNAWAYENGVIYLVVDPRSSGENGRKGMDEAFRRMTVVELGDYIAWAKHLQSLPYVRADRIGVNGFSFGGTTTAMLVLRYPEYFRCGVAGGGVYDWTLYDSHYTERFMDTPQANPEGYREASVLSYIDAVSPAYRPGSLRLTHGTGDDNVHFQNTLQLIDALERKGILFEMMIYPDGMHGYRGAQKDHDRAAESEFWEKWLLGNDK